MGKDFGGFQKRGEARWQFKRVGEGIKLQVSGFVSVGDGVQSEFWSATYSNACSAGSCSFPSGDPVLKARGC